MYCDLPSFEENKKKEINIPLLISLLCCIMHERYNIILEQDTKYINRITVTTVSVNAITFIVITRVFAY